MPELTEFEKTLLLAFKNQELPITTRSRCADLASVLSSTKDHKEKAMSMIIGNQVKTKLDASK